MSAEWSTAIWNTDRWPAVSVEDACQQPPATDRGVPIGIGDWKLVVEILLPAADSGVWGITKWSVDADDGEWGVLAWTDLTPWVRGLEWQRGSDEVYGRPRIGTLNVTLDSQADYWSPWNPTPTAGTPAYFAPGTVIRVGVRSVSDTRADGWLPQITCIVDRWGMDFVAGNAADKFVTVTAVETLRDLSSIDDNALGSPEGGSDTVPERYERLLDTAGWKYGFKVEAQNIIAVPGAYVLQATDMADNRLTECYLVADSTDTTFRTDKTGAALLTNIEYVSTVGAADASILQLADFSLNGVFPTIGFDWQDRESVSTPGLFFVSYAPDSFQSVNEDANIVNDVRIARVGGTQQVFEQEASISRYGRRTFVRNDLINDNDLVIAQIAQYISIRRGLNTLRVNNLTVDTLDRGEDTALVVLASDVQSRVQLYSPDGATGGTRPRIHDGFVASISHKVTPRTPGASVTWTTSYSIDTRTVANIPGGQLPATPA